MKLITISEGEISELHVGLKGTMNALFLKDLAEKNHRRKVNETQSNVVRPILSKFAAGNSPRRIAVALNRDHIPGPRGGDWDASTINGNPARGTGILNNELYIGRLVWNSNPACTANKDGCGGRI